MRAGVRRDVDAFTGHQLAVAEHDAAAGDDPSTPWPGTAAKPATSASSAPVSLACCTIASASGCSDDFSSAAARRKNSLGLEPGERLGLGDHRLAVGERAGLVEDDGLDAVGGLQRVAALDQDAALRALAGADHDGGRRGQTQRARAGDDDHRGAGEQGLDEGRDGGVEARVDQMGHASSQTRKVTAAMPTTAGTNTALMRSAKRWTGALEPWASSTS